MGAKELTSIYSLLSLPSTHITLRVKKGPPATLKEAFRVIVDSLHNFCPIQALNSLCVLNITGAGRGEGGREGGGREREGGGGGEGGRDEGGRREEEQGGRKEGRPSMSQKVINGAHVLEPLLDGVQLSHGNGSNHGNLLSVVLVHKDHVKVSHVKLHPLEVDQLNFIQGDNQRGLWVCMSVLGAQAQG